MSPTQIIISKTQFLEERLKWRAENKSVALVPTMGALHQGHLSLVKLAKLSASKVVVTIFVNPTQFNQAEDLARYPRTIEADMALLEPYGVDIVFAPRETQEIYGLSPKSWVEVTEMGNILEGASRPGHFRAVTTVVSILFNLVQPNIAVFGEKDFQQLAIIEKMVADLQFPLKIVRGPLIRDSDGLALSSRNSRLSALGRQQALALSRCLKVARDAWIGGERSSQTLINIAKDVLSSEAAVVCDYLTIVDNAALLPIPEATSGCRLLVAASVEGVRLLDNMQLGGVLD